MVYGSSVDMSTYRHPITKLEEDPKENDYDSNDRFTCDEAIDAIGFGRYQVILLFLCGVVWAADAMEMMLLSFLLPAASDEWNLKSWEQALIGSIVFVGMLLGSSLWGIISDRFGRKVAFFFGSLFTGIFGVLSAFAPSYIWLLLARALVGFGLGGAHVSFSLFAEFLPQNNRGTPLILFEGFWTVGTVAEAGVAWLVLPHLGWRYLLGLSTIPILLALLFYPLLPESPRYLLVHGKTEQARIQLEKAARINRKILPKGTLALSKTSDTPTPTPENPPVKNKTIQNLKILVSKQYFRVTTLMWLIWFANSFVYYGLVLFAPTLYKSENHESETDDKPKQSIYLDVLITSAAELPGLLLAAVGVDKIGRKKTLAICFLGCAIATGILSAPGGKNFVLVFSMCARMFILGTFSSIYVYTQEVYPTSIRSTGLGICSSMARVAGIVTSFVSDVLSRHSLYIPIAIYGSMALIACVSSFLLPFETKGRPLEEVVHEQIIPDEKTPLVGKRHNKV